MDFINKQFKRNKYGLSDWTKTVKSVSYDSSYEVIDGVSTVTYKLRVCDSTEPPYNWFYLDEIVFVGEDVDNTVKRLESISNKIVKYKNGEK